MRNILEVWMLKEPPHHKWCGYRQVPWHNKIERTITELMEGKRRPCCWAGCVHRNKRGRDVKNKKVYIQ